MIKNIKLLIITLFFLSCNEIAKQSHSEKNQENSSKTIDTIKKFRPDGTKESEIVTYDGIRNGNLYWYDRNENIIGFKHYRNDSLSGYGLSLRENFKPKYLFENNNGKKDGVIIEFYENGVIKSFRNADLFHDSQKIEFHENGRIKLIGQTKKGRAHGTFYYFNDNGLLDKKVEYINGNNIN